MRSTMGTTNYDYQSPQRTTQLDYSASPSTMHVNQLSNKYKDFTSYNTSRPRSKKEVTQRLM